MQRPPNPKIFEVTPLFKVALGSTHPSKIRGVEMGFMSASVDSCDVPLDVGQPRGKKQTEDLAIERALEARSKFPKCDIFIGIQNGIWPLDSTKEISPSDQSYENMLDGACIHLFGKNLDPISLWTREIPVLSYMAKGPKGEWSKEQDPHSAISLIPRACYIEDRLRIYLESFFLKAANLE
jgi:hypothetical protein